VIRLTARKAARVFGVPAKRIRDWSAAAVGGLRLLPPVGKDRRGAHLYDAGLIARLVPDPRTGDRKS
jgi:hypothetical protein